MLRFEERLCPRDYRMFVFVVLRERIKIDIKSPPELYQTQNKFFFFCFVFFVYYNFVNRSVIVRLGAADVHWALRMHVVALLVCDCDGQSSCNLSRPSVGEFSLAGVTSANEFLGVANVGGDGRPAEAGVAHTFTSDHHHFVIWGDADVVDGGFSDGCVRVAQHLVFPVGARVCQ